MLLKNIYLSVYLCERLKGLEEERECLPQPGQGQAKARDQEPGTPSGVSRRVAGTQPLGLSSPSQAYY